MKRFKYLTLAALVGLWACDSGSGTTTEPLVTGTISGTVTIEGTGASGVTVTLSSGTSTTTDASGLYTFSGVNAGAYTVAISGYASDATFDATTKAATITTTGQVATVNFAGSYIKTSSIVGVVSAGAGALEGVTVTLSGASSASATTDASGAYSFSGLRAGSYTVTISGYGSQYTFSATSKDATLGVGESKVVSFSGTYVMTASITGTLFLDENAKDNTYTPGLEDHLTVANVTITLEGNGVSQIPQQSTQTSADGTYSFINLAPGSYRLTIDTTAASLPDNVTYGGDMSVVVPVTAGGTQTANWPFDITVQAVKAYGFLGTDASVSTKPGPGITPVEGWPIDLYDTQTHAQAGGATGKLNAKAVVTDAGGEAVFRFARSADKDPSGATTDQIVFARAAGANADGSPTGPYILNGERIIEIHYNAKDSIGTAPDTLDALVKSVVFAVRAMTIGGDSLATWRVNQRGDTTGAVLSFSDADAHGYAYFTKSTSSFPTTYYMRLAAAQAGAAGHAFMQTPMVGSGVAEGRYVKFVHDGTTAVGDTVWLGEEQVKYLDADIVAQVHHELDDSTDVPTYTLGDNNAASDGIKVTLWKVHPDGKKTAVASMFPAGGGDGTVTFANMLTDSTYQLSAQPANALRVVLNDTLVSVSGMDGSLKSDSVGPLTGGAGFSTFAYKGDQNKINGVLKAIDGSASVTSRLVKIMPDPGNIQPRVFADGSSDTTVVSDATGGYRTYANLREGKWIVMPLDSVTAAGDSIWAFYGAMGTATVKGSTTVEAMDILRAWRMDTKIQGVIANDRDQDQNTIDPNEGLAGATVELYRDDDGGSAAVSADSLMGSTTTDANGAFSFSPLRQGRYIVKPVAGTPSGGNVVILRGLTKGDTAIVHTSAAAAAAGSGNPDGSRTVGITTGWTAGTLILPRWDYSNSTFNLKSMALAYSQPHFTFLYGDGQATGTVTKSSKAVEGMTISAVKCSAATGYTSPPTVPIGAGTCTPTGSAVNVATNASGVFLFTDLQEGVWQITANPATAGLADPVTSALFVILGNADVETGNFAF